MRHSGGVAQAAHQQRHIGALPATVGVQLVEHQKTQLVHGLHKPAVFRPGENVFKHHIIGEQNVGRVVVQFLPIVAFQGPGVRGVGDGAFAFGETVFQIAVQLLELAVGQRVHGVHDHGAGAFARTGFQNMVHNGQNVR